LRTGQIADAVVDCFVREPLPPESHLFDVPNLILTPHMSGVYEEFWPRMVSLMGENLRRFQSGRPLLNVVSPQHGY
jgi:phosphoglycerate dehydrogenase-like enzyme